MAFSGAGGSLYAFGRIETVLTDWIVKMFSKTFSVPIVLGMLGLVGGCGDSSTVRWNGEITFDGMPVESGVVRVECVDGAEPTVGASIVDGKYSLQLTPGKKVVEIAGYKTVGEEPVMGSGGVTRPILEALGEYREVVEVTGSETRNFALDKQ